MNMFDELKKAGFVDKKKARQLKHQERVKAKEKGYDGLEDERKEHEADLKAQQAEERHRQRELAREEERARLERERYYQICDLVRANLITEGQRGPRQFFFVARSGKVPFLTLELETAKKLETGSFAIVEIPDQPFERHGLVPRETARKVHEYDPALVRFATGGFTS